MVRDRNGRGNRAPATVAAYDAEDLESTRERPPTAESSHIARRRWSSAPAHEVTADEIIEIIDDPPQAPTSRFDPWPQPASVPPLALDLARAVTPVDLTITLAPPPKRRPVASALALAALFVLAAVVAVGVVRRGPRLEPIARSFRPSSVAAQPPAPPPTLPPPAANEPPVVDVASLPRAPVGTVIGMPDHRLWVDGRLAPGWKLLVRCGAHTVQVGSAGTAREVDVPCGDELKVWP